MLAARCSLCTILPAFACFSSLHRHACVLPRRAAGEWRPSMLLSSLCMKCYLTAASACTIMLACQLLARPEACREGASACMHACALALHSSERRPAGRRPDAGRLSLSLSRIIVCPGHLSHPVIDRQLREFDLATSISLSTVCFSKEHALSVNRPVDRGRLVKPHGMCSYAWGRLVMHGIICRCQVCMAWVAFLNEKRGRK